METLQRTANRGSVSTATIYEVANSCKFEKDNSERLQRSYSNIGTPTNADKFTFSIWIKRTELQDSGEDIFFCGNAGAVTTLFAFQDNVLKFRTNSGDTEIKTNRLFRDMSAWYHIVVAYDSTDSTEANRVKFYVNGVEETSLGTANYPTQNADSEMFETNMSHFVGSPDGSQTAPGYYTELYFLDGQVKQASDFGEFDSTSGIWIPKAYDGSFGNEGYYLDFEDASNLGLDVSGNSNNFNALYGISSADQATDTCTNNFCTLNPLSAGGNRGNVITEGATKVVIENSGQQVAVGTIAVSSGKWYWEAKHTSGTYQVAGIISADSRVSGNGAVADSSVAGSDAVGFYRPNGYVYYNGTGTTFDTSSYSNGDIIGVALDMDNGTCALYKNGSILGNVSGTDIVARSGHASLTGDWTAFYSDGTNGNYDITYEVNFGGYQSYTISSGNSDANGYGNFEYAPPTGYYALCTKNLAEYG
jgi:hypothetical protein